MAIISRKRFAAATGLITKGKAKKKKRSLYAGLSNAEARAMRAQLLEELRTEKNPKVRAQVRALLR